MSYKELIMQQLKITPSVTARTQTVEDYLRDINRIEMVSPEEECNLASRIKAGDDAAFKRLVEANLRFVVSVAKQYQNRGLDLMDLVNEGNIGLMKAALKFDPSRGFKFISYAVWWIRQQILQALSDQGRMIRIPLNQVGLMNKVGRARSAFLQENEREPSDEELSALLDISPEKLAEVDVSTLSLDYQLGEDDSQSLMDIIPDSSTPETDKALETESLRADLQLVMSVLNERERKVLELSFGLGCPVMTMEEIGESLDLTRERVRQLKVKAINKLSSPKVRSRLAQYL
jgi:RNA polymerase primary sigma factor